MPANEFQAAWPDQFNLVAEIDWTRPAPHDLLFSGGVEEDQWAYLYAIVAWVDKGWWPYYIGKTFAQTVSRRNQQPDHRARLDKLQAKHPSLTFSVSLGTPDITSGRFDEGAIDAIEGLLIFSNWHEDMANERKINSFSHKHQVRLKNTGWTDHLEKEIAYGVFYR
ncbi:MULTISPECIES: hypothetical protein [unclassified Thioalkalivibrio]|uniref:hypothetical protein n=1 Tax=unclassified Thioalkalivibrio TaxID=2621013 RepID=UPI00035FC0AC|nr:MULTISPECIES: hypothetical protein [unclassified Thioalkalivibrio]